MRLSTVGTTNGSIALASAERPASSSSGTRPPIREDPKRSPYTRRRSRRHSQLTETVCSLSAAAALTAFEPRNVCIA